MSAYVWTTYVAAAGPFAGRFVPGSMHENYLEVDGDTPEVVIRRAVLIRDAAEAIIAKAREDLNPAMRPPVGTAYVTDHRGQTHEVEVLNDEGRPEGRPS